MKALPEKFWARTVGGPVSRARPDLGPCLLWTGGKSSGYGRLYYDGAYWYAHRLSWVLTNGSIPNGYEVDHLCFVHACIRPTHLEAVHPAVNNERRGAYYGHKNQYSENPPTHCPQNHPYDEVNTYCWNGHRGCRTCRRANVAKYQARLRAEKAAS